MISPDEKTVRHGFLYELQATLRRYILRGMLVVIPIGVTFYVLVLCYRFTGGLLVPYLRQYSGEMPQYIVAAVSIALFVSILYGFGIATNLMIGRRAIALGESVLRRTPLVKTIYGASRQAVDVLSRQDEATAYQAAVVVPFPSPGMRTIGFVTGRLHIEGQGVFYRVFVPTTPNPTSGYFEIYPITAVEHTDMSVEDAVKAIMSAGILTPEELRTVDVPAPALPAEAPQPVAEHSGPAAVRPAHKGILLSVRRRLVSGFLVLVPIGITVFVLRFVYGLTAGRIEPLTELVGGPLPPYMTVVVSILLLLILLYMTGYVATAVVIARIIRMVEGLIERIPLVTSVYGATKQIVATLIDSDTGPKFQAPVLVSFPYPGVRTVGFIVGTILRGGERLFKVFIPTTPNITVGILVFYKEDSISGCSLSLEEAIKMVVSGGIVGPDSITLRPARTLLDAVA